MITRVTIMLWGRNTEYYQTDSDTELIDILQCNITYAQNFNLTYTVGYSKYLGFYVELG